VAGVLELFEAAAPGFSEFAGTVQRTIRIVGAGDHHALERQGLHRHGAERAQPRRGVRALDVGGRHQQGTRHLLAHAQRQVTDRDAAQAVGDQQRRPLRRLDGGGQGRGPRVQVGRGPVVLLHAQRARQTGFPSALPMGGAGVVPTWDDQGLQSHERMMASPLITGNEEFCVC